ncbi:MAG: hypothetical protein JWM88_299 [Verrucomicrobia bacterium]|nr:hypothetical protein [Verrucomicrobiota bacterium]
MESEFRIHDMGRMPMLLYCRARHGRAAVHRAMVAPPVASSPLTNAEIAQRLAGMAQLLSAQGENPYKIRAYRRAAETIRGLGESIDEQVRADADLTRYAGIGKGIASALREIVLSGKLGQLELLMATVPPEVAELGDYPRLDPKRVLQAYKKLGIHSVPELKARLEKGEIGKMFGARMEQHFRNGLIETQAMLLDDADPLAASIQRFLLERCAAIRAETTGSTRRREETVSELAFVVETLGFPKLVESLARYGGGLKRLGADETSARFQLPAGITLRIEAAPASKWGVTMVATTGSERHLEMMDPAGARLARLAHGKTPYPDESSVYHAFGLALVPPELREGNDELELARRDALPKLVTLEDIRGELHAHTTSSDGALSIAEMAEAARERSYEYLGITDHSQSLKIAGGVSEEDLWKQIRLIDRLNEKLSGIRILKSSEVDILADGSLDYPDDLLAALDYTVCSIHSRFHLGKAEQTERVLRAMDNPHFTILGHATGRLLLKRTGYELDFERVIAHARAAGCFFEINASPDRLDLSPQNARLVAQAGIRIAVCTDAHHGRELDYLRCGIDVARRAGLEKQAVLNCLPLPRLLRAFRR